MAGILDGLRYKPDDQFANGAEDFNAEGKFGVPRFGGEPAALQEYCFRVRARAKRESLMEKSEVAKLGPLGLRLIEGLRGQALRLAQQVDQQALAGTEGHEILLTLFEKSLKPRKTQEARELYAAGSKDGGLLSRQHGEPMSSYIMRRRAWWHHLQQLDGSMQVSEGILAEQLLVNANISEDQRLMVRTTVGSNMTVEKVCDELLNHHPRIHEKEKHGYSKGKNFGSRGHHRPWKQSSFKGNRSFFGDGDWDDDETHSFANFTEESYDPENDHFEGYVAEYDEATSYDMVLAEHMAMYLDEGLNMEDEESCNMAAEAMQLEYEAMFVRNQAKGKGLQGFAAPRHFEVSGQLSMQEKKARLQQLKNRTECRKCGQRGHWSGDPQCPKSSKGSSKGKSSGSSSTSKSFGKKAGKGQSGEKTRVVYFAMHGSHDGEAPECNMAVHRESERGDESSHNPTTPPRMTSSTSMTSVPPLSSFSRMPGPNQSSSSMPSSSSRPETSLPSMPWNPAMNQPPTGLQEFYDMGWKADDVLEHLLATQPNVLGLPDASTGPTLTPSQAASFTPQSWMANPLVSQALGTLVEMDSEMAIQDPPESDPPPPEPEEPPGADPACQHLRITRRGSNFYYTFETCVDCKRVLKRERRTHNAPPKANPVAAPPPTGPPCQHQRVHWRGSNGYHWRMTCVDCGHVTSGRWQDDQKGSKGSGKSSVCGSSSVEMAFDRRDLHELVRSMTMVAAIKMDEKGGRLQLHELHDIMEAVANNMTGAPTAPLRSPEFHSPMASSPAMTTPQGESRNSQDPSSLTSAAIEDDRIVDFGKYKGKTFLRAFQDDSYVNWALREVNEGSCRGLKNLAR